MKTDLFQQHDYDPMVVVIADEIENHFGVEFTQTSGIRLGDKGVHGYGRGIDLRCPVRQFGIMIAKWVNSEYEYDHERPKKMCCVYHATKGGALHLHLQSHHNTKKR